jgi:hypothetical protein
VELDEVVDQVGIVLLLDPETRICDVELVTHVFVL